MMWDRIYGALRTPGETLRQVAENRLWKEGLLIILVVALLHGMSSIAAAGNQTFFRYLENMAQHMEQPIINLAQHSPALMITSSLIGGLLAWVIFAAVFFLFAKLFKGQGTFIGMLAGLGYASTPYFIGVPLAAVSLLAGIVGYFLSSAINIATGIWVFVLYIIAIKESQQVSTGAAVATFFIPVIMLGIAMIILLGIIVALLMAFSGF